MVLHIHRKFIEFKLPENQPGVDIHFVNIADNFSVTITIQHETIRVSGSKSMLYDLLFELSNDYDLEII